MVIKYIIIPIILEIIIFKKDLKKLLFCVQYINVLIILINGIILNIIKYGIVILLLIIDLFNFQ